MLLHAIRIHICMMVFITKKSRCCAEVATRKSLVTWLPVIVISVVTGGFVSHGIVFIDKNVYNINITILDMYQMPFLVSLAMRSRKSVSVLEEGFRKIWKTHGKFLVQEITPKQVFSWHSIWHTFFGNFYTWWVELLLLLSVLMPEEGTIFMNISWKAVADCIDVVAVPKLNLWVATCNLW